METADKQIAVNNDLYDSLGERWYEAYDDPVALLRAESQLHGPWIIDRITREKLVIEGKTAKVLDVGCGGGFKANYLAQKGFAVTGIDLSAESLAVAKKHDKTGTVKYIEANAAKLPFEDASFDVVIAMDFLEHVEDPGMIIHEMARVLKPGGVFFFHTFNRNWIAGFVVIKLVEWIVKNTPPHMHVLRLFIKPQELKADCVAAGLSVKEMLGVQPNIFSWSVVKALFTGVVPRNFSFKFVSSTLTAYSGYAVKNGR